MSDGVYVDVDFACVKPLDDLTTKYSFFTGMSNVGAVEVNNGLIGAAPKHPLTLRLLELVGKPWPEWGGVDVDPAQAAAHVMAQQMPELAAVLAGGEAAPFIATTGPGFFTRCLMQQSMSSWQGDVAILPAQYFYPLRNSDRADIDAVAAAVASNEAYAVHHWCRTWE
mmetsp:Transcript_90601/g.242665  ORF Transcript_90601/g.242665 Transcript_90601/m.242665 type:complete len:168 (-) Transcript_90601:40-543(-)